MNSNFVTQNPKIAGKFVANCRHFGLSLASAAGMSRSLTPVQLAREPQ
jgi:hypothetical protein